MREGNRPQLPADEVSTAEVPSDAWRDKITPRTLYDQVSADPRAQARVDATTAKINERGATLAQVRGR